MSLRKNLEKIHHLLSGAKIEHVLIGGMALAAHGVHRNTIDLDFLIDGKSAELVKEILKKENYRVTYESQEVMQFSGQGMVDFILANRDLSRKMLESAILIPHLGVRVALAEDIIGLKIQAYKNNPSRELQDKADIQAVIQKNKSLDWEKIKAYADIFQEWAEIQKIRGKA